MPRIRFSKDDIILLKKFTCSSNSICSLVVAYIKEKVAVKSYQTKMIAYNKCFCLLEYCPTKSSIKNPDEYIDKIITKYGEFF